MASRIMIDVRRVAEQYESLLRSGRKQEAKALWASFVYEYFFEPRLKKER